MSQGYFDGSMPREVLEYYLAHAASAQWISQSDTLDDDIRVTVEQHDLFEVAIRAVGIGHNNYFHIFLLTA